MVSAEDEEHGVRKWLDKLSVLQSKETELGDFSMKDIHTAKPSAEKFKPLKSIFLLVLLCAVSLNSFAITFGVPDCEDNATNTNCKHPNVVMISGFDANGVTVPETRCSGSLIKADSDKAIILTAGHCALRDITPLVGVTFDAKVFKPDPTVNVFNDDQFIHGALPIVNFEYPTDKSYRVDFGAVIIPLTNGIATTVDGRQIDIKNITPVTLAPLGYIDALVKAHQEINVVDVGYGSSTILKNPDKNGNAIAGISNIEFGTRNISENGLFQNGSVWGGTLLKIQQNHAKDQSGVCIGDSGGPTFAVDFQGKETQVGIHSGGNSVLCNSYQATYRVDIAPTQAFLACLLVDGKSIAALLKCGITIE